MEDKEKIRPYGSVRDLPSVKEIEQQIRAFKALRFLLPKEHRQQLKSLEKLHKRTTEVVDTFYELLGKRNWVFTDDLNLTALEHVVSAPDPETTEQRLIGYYKDVEHIEFPLRRLHRFEAMRPRISLLKKALKDYEEGRYYSTVLVLLSVMDGFVNDVETAHRRGLHTRSEDDMVAWDSVAGHHLGLSHAHQTFLKGFYKTDTTEVIELFRNGIVHGALVSFDNDVVATKAWNRLFAVTDWAEARECRAKPAEDTPSFRELFNNFRNTQDQRKKLDAWHPYHYIPSKVTQHPSEVAETCADFLERWQKKQWGLVGDHFIKPGCPRLPTGKLAGTAKELYCDFDLTHWTLLCVRHVAAAVAHTDVELIVNGDTYRTELRWVRIDDSGNSSPEWEPGRWTLSLYGPTNFLKPARVVKRPLVGESSIPNNEADSLSDGRSQASTPKTESTSNSNDTA